MFLVKLRRVRTNKLVCTILTILIVATGFIIYKIILYNNYIRSYPFSTVPFWKDNRTKNYQPPLPILKVEDVNLTNESIVITACCRNVRGHLPGFQRNIQTIAALFGKYYIYMGESDSNDDTLTFLNEWQANDSVHVRVISQGNLRRRGLSRTNRIAFCRNALLQEARKELLSFDYYFTLDVDVGASTPFEIKDFLSNFIYPRSSWLAMTATQRGGYYDIWALRVKPVLLYDCWELIAQLSLVFINRSFLTDHLVGIHQEHIPRNTSLIEVESAFGGAAVYNEKYLNEECSYNGRMRNVWWWSEEQCEHVPFHYCIRKYAPEQKMYINPQFKMS